METREDRLLTASNALALAAVGLQALEQRRQEINDLNVYPVPDGDTGTNLALTLKSVVADLQAADPDARPDELARMISEAALMGARGNSGVILSQIIRGAMEVIAEGPEMSPQMVAGALENARVVAYRAVRKPVEGTMLTVVKSLAETAEKTAATMDGVSGDIWGPVLEAGWKSVEDTPTLLRVLRDAGVVDAGGYGLMTLLDALVHGEGGKVPEIQTFFLPREEVREEVVSPYTYCTSFLVRGAGLDANRLERDLSTLGDSLMVVGNGAQVKVHVHTDEPHRALEHALLQGSLSAIEIANMKEQQADRTERLGSGDSNEGEVEGEASSGEERVTDVVAVVSGDGNKELYRSMGADVLVEGGQSMNPSAEELLAAVRQTCSNEVIILPNNKNIIMTAEQVAARADGKVRVLPTKSVPAGLSALVAFDSGRDGRTNYEEMNEVLAGIATGEVTRAVRDSRVNGLDIKEGTYIGLVSGEVEVVSTDIIEVAEAVAERLVAKGAEIVTVLLGAAEDGDLVGRAAEQIEKRFAEVEVEIHWGGQPLYPLLMAAE